MGVLLIILGLASAGLVADFVVENGLTSGGDLSFQLFGGSFHLNPTEIILAAAVLGALAIVLIFLGVGVTTTQAGKRRERRARAREARDRLNDLEQRNVDLERENRELRHAAAPQELGQDGDDQAAVNGDRSVITVFDDQPDRPRDPAVT